MTYAGRRKLYRSRHNRMIFGVCQGIADWRDMDVTLIRIILVLLCIFTGFAPFGVIYLVAAFLIPLEPSDHADSFRRGRSRRGAFDDIKEEFDDLKDRVHRMEDDVIDKERDWEDRFKRGK